MAAIPEIKRSVRDIKPGDLKLPPASCWWFKMSATEHRATVESWKACTLSVYTSEPVVIVEYVLPYIVALSPEHGWIITKDNIVQHHGGWSVL